MPLPAAGPYRGPDIEIYELTREEFYGFTAGERKHLLRKEINYQNYLRDPVGWWLDKAQLGADLAGMIPVVGDVVDILNGLVSAVRGNYGEAGISLAAAMPFVGIAVGPANAGRRLAKLADQSRAQLQQINAKIAGKAGEDAAVIEKLRAQARLLEDAIGDIQKEADRMLDAAKNADNVDAAIRVAITSKADEALAPLVKQFPDAKVGFRGSLARGTKGTQKGGGPFDPSDFDVDAFIVSDELAAAIPKDAKGFRNLGRLTEHQRLIKSISDKLRGIVGHRDKAVKIRVFSVEEFKKLLPNEIHLLN